MKTCPVCGARCFDDMDVCYGCMHRFGPGDAASAPQAATVFGQAANPAAYQSTPSTSPAPSASNVVAFPGQGTPATPSVPPGTAASAPFPASALPREGALEGGSAPSGVQPPSVPCAPASSPQAIATPDASCEPNPGGGAAALEPACCEGAVGSAPAASRPAASGARSDAPSHSTPDGVACEPERAASPANDVVAMLGATAVSQPISLGELTQGMTFQLVVTLRPCPPASAGEGA